MTLFRTDSTISNRFKPDNAIALRYREYSRYSSVDSRRIAISASSSAFVYSLLLKI